MGMLVVAPAGSFHPHSHHHHHHDSLFPSAGGDHHHPIIPLLSVVDDSAKGVPPAGIPLWQPQPQNPNLNLTSAAAPYLKKPVPALDVASGGGSATCQDCGNQAKKDCPHRRCRTCCKSRGFECNTHVKSTWVPAARRRERQLSGPGGGPGPGSSTSTSAPKKPRLSSQTTSHTSTSNTTRSFDTGSSRRQDASFRESLPGQVQAPAVFKCVRVTSIDDGKDEYAYHAMVRIGGHLFKGFLYDHGAEDRGDESHHHAIAAGETGANTTNNASNAIPNISELHLGGGGGGGGGGRNGASSSSPMLPSDMFGGGGGGLLGGTAYGNPIN